MGNNVAEQTIASDGVEGSEATIEIKIKTLDSQTYTLKVDKQVISQLPLCVNMFTVYIKIVSLVDYVGNG